MYQFSLQWFVDLFVSCLLSLRSHRVDGKQRAESPLLGTFQAGGTKIWKLYGCKGNRRRQQNHCCWEPCKVFGCWETGWPNRMWRGMGGWITTVRTLPSGGVKKLKVWILRRQMAGGGTERWINIDGGRTVPSLLRSATGKGEMQKIIKKHFCEFEFWIRFWLKVFYNIVIF